MSATPILKRFSQLVASLIANQLDDADVIGIEDVSDTSSIEKVKSLTLGQLKAWLLPAVGVPNIIDSATMPAAASRTNGLLWRQRVNGNVVTTWEWDASINFWVSAPLSATSSTAKPFTGAGSRFIFVNNPGFGEGVLIKRVGITGNANTSSHNGSNSFSIQFYAVRQLLANTNLGTLQNTQAFNTTTSATIEVNPGIQVPWGNFQALGFDLAIIAGTPSMDFRSIVDVRAYLSPA